jgi:hypothetical protein
MNLQFVVPMLINYLGILIHRLKAPVEDIIEALLTLDEQKLSLDNTRNLLKLAPTDDEVITKYT